MDLSFPPCGAQVESSVQRASVAAGRSTQQLEETVGSFQRQKLNDLQVPGQLRGGHGAACACVSGHVCK